MNRVKNNFDTETLQSVIDALVINKLTYGSTIRSNTSARNIKNYKQCRTLRPGLSKKSGNLIILHPVFKKELNWLSIEQLLLYRDSIMAYKCFNNLAPSYLTNKFIKRYDIIIDLLEIMTIQTYTGFQDLVRAENIWYRAVKIWRNLDNELKQITTVDKFKKN